MGGDVLVSIVFAGTFAIIVGSLSYSRGEVGGGGGRHSSGLDPLIVAPIIAGAILLVIIPRFVRLMIGEVARALEEPRTERVVRWAGLTLLLVGFHFDLLSS
jgi:hypothetical protein